jgi:hypothetical protein
MSKPITLNFPDDLESLLETWQTAASKKQGVKIGHDRL